MHASTWGGNDNQIISISPEIPPLSVHFPNAAKASSNLAIVKPTVWYIHSAYCGSLTFQLLLSGSILKCYERVWPHSQVSSLCHTVCDKGWEAAMKEKGPGLAV